MVVVALSLTACTGGQEGVHDPIWPVDFETAWPEVRDCRLSPAAHDGFYIRVFANPEAAAAYTEGSYPFVRGTMLIKGSYDDSECTTLEQVSAMLKLAVGADPGLGDWHWQRTDADGYVTMETPARSCAGCHLSCSATDYACTDP